MKITLLNDSRQGIGGGWTFRRNLKKGLEQLGHSVIDRVVEADVALITAPTMVRRDTLHDVISKGIKTVLRLDNVPRNSRNRNTGTSRLQEYSKLVDEVVYQCKWARFYLKDFTGREGKIIYNGIDTDIFNTKVPRINFGKYENMYVYCRFNRDETKNWEVAWYKFQLIYRDNPDAKLIIIGKFSPEQGQYNFDFFRGESFDYRGIITDPHMMAMTMRGCKYFLATYYNDCYSNTYQEALACGMELYEPDMSGGTQELIKNGVINVRQMAEEYVKVFKQVLEG